MQRDARWSDEGVSQDECDRAKYRHLPVLFRDVPRETLPSLVD